LKDTPARPAFTTPDCNGLRGWHVDWRPVRLRSALLFTLLMHGLGMVAMAALLLPGMPGGGTLADAARIAYIAEHPGLWRLGWLPWQLTAVSDLLLAVALLRDPAVPRRPAVLAALVTVAAVIPDQLGQACWITKGIALAQTDAAAYLVYETRIFTWTAAWGATLYTVGALGWTWCFAAARLWNRPLTLLSAVLWPLFFAASLGPFFALDGKLVAAGNALGFVLLELWFALVLEQVLRRERPDALHGRQAPWRHPGVRALDAVANSRLLRFVAERLPLVAFRSDIRDVVYVSYIVEAERLLPLVPSGLALDRIGPEGRFAVFTLLTYRHGHFGPRLLGPARGLLPSPVQSNWRIHVRHPGSGRVGITFVTNAVSSTAYALGARLLCEGLPMHVPRKAELARTAGGAITVRLDPGRGSAPDLEARLLPTEPPADGPWQSAFATWHDFLAYVVPQDRALSSQPWRGRVTSQEIDLGIPLRACQALAGEVRSRRARELAGDAEPIAFLVPRVTFLFDREDHLPL
jgi:hypothetical protein